MSPQLAARGRLPDGQGQAPPQPKSADVRLNRTAMLRAAHAKDRKENEKPVTPTERSRAVQAKAKEADKTLVRSRPALNETQISTGTKRTASAIGADTGPSTVPKRDRPAPREPQPTSFFTRFFRTSKRKLAISDPFEKTAQDEEPTVAEVPGEDPCVVCGCSDLDHDMHDYVRCLESTEIQLSRLDYLREYGGRTSHGGSDFRVSVRMRALCIDWTMRVHHHLGLRNTTFYLAVNFFDRFLRACWVDRNQLQLVAIVATFVAAKYEERFPPTIDKLISLTQSAYRKEQFELMESRLLSTLDYRLMSPEPSFFVHRLLSHTVEPGNARVADLSTFLIDLMISRPEHTQSPSKLAAVAVYLAQWIVFAGTDNTAAVWALKLAHRSGYGENDLAELAAFVIEKLQRVLTTDRVGDEQPAVLLKYTSKTVYGGLTMHIMAEAFKEQVRMVKDALDKPLVQV